MKCSPWAARTRPLPSVDVGLEALNVAEVDGLAQRCEWVAGGHELVRHIPMVISSGDAPHDAIPLHFLGAIQLVPMRNSTGVEVASKAIGYAGGELQVPDMPVIPFIEGDGTGRDIWKASRRVFDAAVEHAYSGKRRIAWFEVFAGEKAFNIFKEWLPNDTVEAIRDFRVAIKGPLTTPVGGGIRSLNVALRQLLDLYSCE